MYYIMPAIFFIGAIVLLFVLRNSNKTVSEIPENIQETELTSRFLMGQYVEGLPGQKEPSPLVYCGITEDDFVFRRGTNGVEIGRISRNSLTNIKVSKGEDAKYPWSIKKHQYCCLEINWCDFETSKQKAVFRFAEKKAEDVSNEAAKTLKKWQKATQTPNAFVSA